MRKWVRLSEEYPHSEDGLLVDKNYEELLGLVQLGDENLDNFSVDQARSLHNVDPRCKISKEIRYHQEAELLDERNFDVPETLRKSRVTVKAKVLENVKSEPLDFDSGGMNECSNKSIRLKRSETPVPLKGVVLRDNVKVEAPDSDSGGNQEISEHCSKRPRLEVSNTPQMLKSSLVKKKNKVNRTSRRILKEKKMKIDRPNKSPRVLPRKKSGMKKKVNVKAAHGVSGMSNVLFSKRKGSQVLHSSRCRRNPEAFLIHMDETYEAFLNLAVVFGNQMIYTPRNGTGHIFEEDMQSSSDSEQTILYNNRRDRYRPSYVKTRAATNKTLRKDVMKRKMSCPKNNQDTSSDADLNQQDSHQHEDYRASYAKTKAATNRTWRKYMMKKNMSCSKYYQDTSLDSILNEQDSHQHDGYSASNVSENFEVFKTFIELDGKSLIYKRSNGGQKIYEEVQTTSDAETIVETNAMHSDTLDSSRTI